MHLYLLIFFWMEKYNLTRFPLHISVSKNSRVPDFIPHVYIPKESLTDIYEYLHTHTFCHNEVVKDEGLLGVTHPLNETSQFGSNDVSEATSHHYTWNGIK